jgi:hypothetical protein
MISLKVLQIALFAVILTFLVLLMTDVFRSPGTAWIEDLLIAAIVALGVWVTYRRRMLRTGRTSMLKRTRDSLLKWRWEERNKREW